MEIDPDEQRAITEVVDRLATQFPGTTPAQVEQLVDAAHHEFDQSPIRSFVPVLVERKAKARLGADR